MKVPKYVTPVKVAKHGVTVPSSCWKVKPLFSPLSEMFSEVEVQCQSKTRKHLQRIFTMITLIVMFVAMTWVST